MAIELEHKYKYKYKYKDPLVSVIICAYSIKRWRATINCINSVLNNGYKNTELILVIDGNEELKEKMEAGFRGVKRLVIIGGRTDEGPYASRNRGVAAASGEIVAFIDDDAFAPADWIERITRNFYYYPEILAAGGKLLPVYENGCSRLPEELLWMVGCTYKGHPERKQFVRNVISANMAVKRDVFKETGFETMYCREHNNGHMLFPIKQLEDTVFCVRLNSKKENAVLYVPEAVVYHTVPRERLNLEYILRRAFSEGMLKAKLGYATRTTFLGNGVFSQERSYLNRLLVSTVKNFCTLKVKDGLLMSLAAMSVAAGYAVETVRRSR